MASDYNEEHGYNEAVFDNVLKDTLDLEGFDKYLQTHKSVSRYSNTNEKKIDHDWWKLNKTEIDTQIRELTQVVITVVEGHPSKDTELDHLYRSAKSLSQVQRSPPIKVGIIGAQAVGKSLFTNALFGKSGLSPTGADGKACTSSIIAYKNYREDSTAGSKGTFHAFVSFLNAAKRQAMIHEHAKTYFFYAVDGDDSDEEISNASADKDTKFDRAAMKTAEEFFATIFGTQEEFLSSWSVSSFKTGEFAILCEMKCNEAITSAKADIAGDVCTFIGKDHQDLMKQIKPYIVKVKGKICLWPLVDKVSVSFCDEILEQNIEILDVPGWGDTNSTRARHYEDIRETVDVEIVLADSLRAGTDKPAIENAVTAVALHGAKNVKIVATKIDSVSEDQLDHCEGPFYDQIRKMIEDTEERQENEDGDTDVLERYQTYLRRQRKKAFIKNRSVNLTKDISKEFTGSSELDIPEVYHVSASDFITWTKQKKISFDSMPALTAEETNVPSIRQLLLSLPAEQNLSDYRHHINVLIPAFIAKIERTISDTDRDEGFRELADRIDDVRQAFIEKISTDAKVAFNSISKFSVKHMERDILAYKHQVDLMIEDEWLAHKGKAFEKLMKCHGSIPAGASNAKTLKNGCDLNKDLADVLRPAFVKWYKHQESCMDNMASAQEGALQHVHQRFISMIQESDANVIVIEKAKRKFKDVPKKMSAKLTAMMNQISDFQKRSFHMAVMTAKVQQNCISSVTDVIFDKVFAAVPATRELTTGRNKGTRVPVSSKIKCQQDELKRLTSNRNIHLVDAVIDEFRCSYDRKINNDLIVYFQEIGRFIEDVCEALRKESPVVYQKEPLGESMREKLGEKMPMIRELHKTLQKNLPSQPKSEEEAMEMDMKLKETSGDNVSEIYERLCKKRKLTKDIEKGAMGVKKEKL